MADTDDKPKKHERLRRLFDFIFGFENKRGEVLDSWIYSAENFSISPQEFYGLVEEELAQRKIPNMEIKRQEFAEAGLLSDQRLYLRLMRERLSITTCAAPFGRIFFFSCRTVYVPALVRLWHILAANFLLNIPFWLLYYLLDLKYALIAWVALIFALVGVMRNASSGAFEDLDALLLKIPVVATIYEDWFRVETYYREDTRALYRKLIPALILESAEEACASKGIKLQPYTQPPTPINTLSSARPKDEAPSPA